MRTSIIQPTAIAIFVACFVTTSISAEIITFENTPGGSIPVDDALLTVPYGIVGGTVRLFFDTNGNNTFDSGIDAYPVFEQSGDDDVNGFGSSFNGIPDTARPGYGAQLGQFFLRPATNTSAAPLIAEYNTTVAVSRLSGEIWDIDGIARLGTEQWRVDVLNLSNEVVATQLSPVGVTDLPSSLDSLPWLFSFTDLPPGADKLRLTFVGNKTQGIGVAFNNFGPLAVPEPTSVQLLATALFCAALFRLRQRTFVRYRRASDRSSKSQ